MNELDEITLERYRENVNAINDIQLLMLADAIILGTLRNFVKSEGLARAEIDVLLGELLRRANFHMGR